MKAIKPIRAIIVDDERLARVNLKRLLEPFPDIEIAGEAESCASAVEAINLYKPELIFLDIQLGGETGFDLLEMINNSISVIFVTAYDEYAIRAFEVNAADYLLKPVKPDRLRVSVDRIIQEHKERLELKDGKQHNGEREPNDPKDSKESTGSTGSKDSTGSAGSAGSAGSTGQKDLKNAPKVFEYSDTIYVHLNNSTSKFIKISSITYIEPVGNYTRIVTTEGKRCMVLKTLKQWIEELPSRYFIRIHRSSIVNLEQVDHIEKHANTYHKVYLKNLKEPLEVSRRFASQIKTAHHII